MSHGHIETITSYNVRELKRMLRSHPQSTKSVKLFYSAPSTLRLRRWNVMTEYVFELSGSKNGFTERSTAEWDKKSCQRLLSSNVMRTLLLLQQQQHSTRTRQSVKKEFIRWRRCWKTTNLAHPWNDKRWIATSTASWRTTPVARTATCAQALLSIVSIARRATNLYCICRIMRTNENDTALPVSQTTGACT